MTQNPYSQNYPGGGAGAGQGMFRGDAMPPETRTSALAVTSLVLGLLSLVGCCITGVPLGVPAGVLGGIALVRIGSSQGQLGGRGLAIGGIVTGTIGLILQVAMLVGGAQALGYLNTWTTQSFQTLETGDPTALKGIMSPQAMAQLDEAKLKAFRTEVKSQLGTIQRTTPGLMQLINNYTNVAKRHPQLMEDTQRLGQNPWLARGEFTNGTGYVFFALPQRGGGQGGAPPVENVAVIAESSGKVIWLLPPAGGSSAPSAPATTPEPDAKKGAPTGAP